MTVFIMVQARQGSKRFKNKVLNKINNQELIKIQFSRLKKIKSKNKIIYLIPKNNNDSLKKFLIENSIDFFQGDENNVLSRYYQAAKKMHARKIIRLTGDCPLIDFRIVDKLIKLFHSVNVDYISNTIERTYPHGMDMEMFTFETLKKIESLAKTTDDKEHVTRYLIKNKKKFLIKNFVQKNNQSNFRITVDYPEDLSVIKKIINYFNDDIFFSSKQIINFLTKYPKVNELNSMRKIY